MASKAFLGFSSPKPTFPRSEIRSSRFQMAFDLTTKPRKQLSPLEPRLQKIHSMPPEKLEIFKSLEKWVEENVLNHLKPVEKSWQPQDFLPDPSSEAFLDDIREVRARAKEIPDDYYACLVGDMITEEALPTYQSMFNITDGVRDETASSLSPWAIWTRLWTAEENRHGDLLNTYLYLSGRVDMKQIEKTIQYLIGSGMDAGLENNPYFLFIYTSFQERATFISHGNTARLAKEFGDINLAKICGTIAADEKRHELAYSKIVEKLFETDPNTTMMAFAAMMRKNITMPARMMYDGKNQNLFQNYTSVAQRMGVYTTRDYLDIFEFLMRRWNVDKVAGLSAHGVEAQDYLCGLGQRMTRLMERSEKLAKLTPPVPFSWIFDRQV